MSSSPDQEQRTVLVPVQFLVGHDSFMEMAAEAGREAGLDDDWKPRSLHEAVYEALISTTCPSESGMIVRPAHMAREDDVFTTEIYVRFLDGPGQMMERYGEYLPDGFEPTLDNLMLGLLNLQAPPVDVGFEIIDSQVPWHEPTAHEVVEQADQVKNWRFSGEIGSTIFAA